MSNAWGALEWGQGSWAAQGDVGLTVSGISVTSSIGDVSIDNELQLGWGADTWGENSWGDLSGVHLTVTGISLTSAIGGVASLADGDVPVTGISLTATNGGVDAFPVSQIEVTGISASTAIGNSSMGHGIPVTGSSVTTAVSSVTIDDEFLIGEGWGRDTWGNLGWGVNYTVIGGGVNGIGLTSSIGNEDAFSDSDILVDGIGLQSAITPVGTSANSDNEIAHSFLLQSSIDDVSVIGTANVDVTGIGLSITLGEAVGGTIQEVPVTGSQLQSAIGNEDTAGNADVEVSGISASSNIGNITPVSGYDASGISVTASTGSVTPIGNATVSPTGIVLTSGTIAPNIIAWAEVDTGTPVTWTDVDIAA